MPMINEMRLDFTATPENEAFARLAVSGFMLPLDPTVEELADVKTAVSEAVTNAIIHGYGGGGGLVRMSAAYDGKARCRSRSSIMAAGSRIFSSPGSPSLPPAAVMSGPAWALPSWRASWTMSTWTARRGRARPCA